ncbi:hypothetical protein B0H14DRAFT_3853096 [Mycena olivaceomarginata]|nr:hypothetical protein B0H14DRAFT_3853096 [Mycena olivaceomarginata]
MEMATPENIYIDSAPFSTRDQSFLRILLHGDYLRLKQHILHDELAFLRSNPGTPFYVTFDYLASYTTCKPIVAASSTFPRPDSVGWSLQNGWANKSRGRMQVDVIRFRADIAALPPVSVANTLWLANVEEEMTNSNFSFHFHPTQNACPRVFSPLCALFPPLTAEGIKSNSNTDVFVFALSALDNKLHTPCHICVRHKASPPSSSPLRLMCTAPWPVPAPVSVGAAPSTPPGSPCPCLSSAPSSSRRGKNSVALILSRPLRAAPTTTTRTQLEMQR